MQSITSDTSVFKHIDQLSFGFAVPNIYGLASWWSNDMIMQDITWRIKVAKENHGGKEYLSVYLYCSNSHNSSEWSHTVTASFKLHLLEEEAPLIVRHLRPFVFSRSNNSNGFTKFIDWYTLLDATKKHKRGDEIRFNIKIETAEPDGKDKSKLVFKQFDKCCEDVGKAKFQLTVKNVQSLIALRTPEFKMRGIPLYFIVFKHMNQLGISLESNGSKVVCQMTMTVNLISSKSANTIVRKICRCIKSHDSLSMESLMPWYALLQMENRFSIGNAITIDIELHAVKLEETAPDTNNQKMNTEDEHKPLECPVCYHTIASQPISFTLCGHLFCTACITKAVDRLKLCPICQRELTMDNICQAFLPL